MRHARNPSSPRRAFTLTELLVVIGVIVLLIAIAVPAFSSLLSSSERSLAENQFKVGLLAARDAAIRSTEGDGAAVFFCDEEGRISIVPCIMVGRISDQGIVANATYTSASLPARAPSTDRDVFVPDPTSAPIRLPRGWSVRGYTPAGTLHTTVVASGEPCGWYEALTALVDGGNWVFPETNYYDSDPIGSIPTEGAKRQTFMVRFKAQTGMLDSANRSLAIVVDPSVGSVFRSAAPYINARIDQATELTAFVRRTLARPGLTPLERQELLGDRSIDTVLARPVTELALYQELRMAARLGGNINRRTQNIYGNTTNDPVVVPLIDTSLFGGRPIVDVQRNINEWIEGRYVAQGATPLPSEARIYTMQQYLGQVQEIQP